MANKNELQLETTLKQRITQQMIEYGQILEMSQAQLEERVRAELDDNPALELSQEQATEDFPTTDPNEDRSVRDNDTNEDFSSKTNDSSDDNQNDDYDMGYAAPSQQGDDFRTNIMTDHGSLIDYLMEQVREHDITPLQEKIAEYIIGNLETSGFLIRSVREITDDLLFNAGLDEIDDDDVSEMLRLVRSLEPAGIAASSYQDCLLLQLERKEQTDVVKLTTLIIKDFYDDFIERRIDKIRIASGLNITEIKQVYDYVRKLNPKPINAIIGIDDDSHSQQIIPDFNIEVEGNRLNISLQNKIPELNIAESYRLAVENAPTKQSRSDKNEMKVIKTKYTAARDFISMIRQRQETMFAIMRSIALRQKEFFLTGDQTKLKPLILKNVADETGFDLSVVSRVTSNKYVNTEWGVFKLKYFFSESLKNEQGEDASTREIKAMIKRLIDNERKEKPLSDEQLCNALRRHGYTVARRTIAKYREKLNIPVARLRKVI